MAFIKIIPPKKATGETADAYRYMVEMGGYDRIPGIIRVFSLRPGSMRRMIRSWELALWMGDEPRSLREMVGAGVSRMNRCHY